MVTADGDVVRASAREHPELFWALRGGDPGFGGGLAPAVDAVRPTPYATFQAIPLPR